MVFSCENSLGFHRFFCDKSLGTWFLFCKYHLDFQWWVVSGERKKLPWHWMVSASIGAPLILTSVSIKFSFPSRLWTDSRTSRVGLLFWYNLCFNSFSLSLRLFFVSFLFYDADLLLQAQSINLRFILFDILGKI